MRFILQVQENVGQAHGKLKPDNGCRFIAVPVVKLAREKLLEHLKNLLMLHLLNDTVLINKGWFIGYKLHVVIFDNGVV
jgi:hypothetical protein